jgi:hypothetical protein
MDITIITAFYDIGRSKWTHFSRNVDYYINSFKNYIKQNYKMIVFIDDCYYEILKNFLRQSHYQGQHIQLIPINKEWLHTHLFSWQQYDKVNHIMTQETYKNLCKTRMEHGHPENIYPEYNIINHSKIDFIYHVIDKQIVSKDDFLIWSDFGYHYSILQGDEEKYPKSVLDIHKFNVNKLNFCLCSSPINDDFDPIFTLVNARTTFTGSLFGGPQNFLMELYHLYHNCLNELYDTYGISDDDQHIYLRCFQKKPELFYLYIFNGYLWPEALTYFQRNNDYTD